MIEQRLIFDDICLSSAEDVIRFMGQEMYALERVKKTYVDAVIDREKVFPTGLDLGGRGIAIPHTEAQHVNQTTISVARLMNEIPFQQMLDPTMSINVKFVFLLAVQDPEGQLDVLKKLMSIFQNQEMLDQLDQAKSAFDIAEMLKDIFRKEEK